MHLDPRTYAALLDGRLPPREARALAEHLAGDCETCERFLAEREETDRLDGPVDAALLEALPPQGTGGNDLEFARIQRGLRSGAGRRRRFLAPAAVAASLLVAGLAGLAWRSLRAPPRADLAWTGEKGAAPRAIPVRLRFLVVGAGGEVVKGIPGEAIDRGARLLFEVEAARPATVALVRVAPGGAMELLWQRRVQGGATQVTVGERPAAYPLADLSGPQRFVLLASDGELDAPRVRRAASALAPPLAIRSETPELVGLSLDALEVSVR
jgi:hypothetical protein